MLGVDDKTLTRSVVEGGLSKKMRWEVERVLQSGEGNVDLGAKQHASSGPSATGHHSRRLSFEFILPQRSRCHLDKDAELRFNFSVRFQTNRLGNSTFASPVSLRYRSSSPAAVYFAPFTPII